MVVCDVRLKKYPLPFLPFSLDFKYVIRSQCDVCFLLCVVLSEFVHLSWIYIFSEYSSTRSLMFVLRRDKKKFAVKSRIAPCSSAMLFFIRLM